jgi:hypothetical protein
MAITRRETLSEYFQFPKEFTFRSVTPLDILSIHFTKTVLWAKIRTLKKVLK